MVDNVLLMDKTIPYSAFVEILKMNLDDDGKVSNIYIDGCTIVDIPANVVPARFMRLLVDGEIRPVLTHFMEFPVGAGLSVRNSDFVGVDLKPPQDGGMTNLLN